MRSATNSATNTSLLTITVLDTATIFEGRETVYRYDLPGTAIVEGWALSGALDQAAKICGPGWPDVTARVVADRSGSVISHEAVKILTRQLRLVGVELGGESPTARGSAPEPAAPGLAQGLSVAAGPRHALVDAPPTPTETHSPSGDADSADAAGSVDAAASAEAASLPDYPHGDEFYEDPVAFARPQATKEHTGRGLGAWSWQQLKERIPVFPVLLGAVVVTVAAGCLWLIGRDAGAQDAKLAVAADSVLAGEAASESAAGGSAASGGAASESAASESAAGGTGEAAADSAEPEYKRIEAGGMSVVLPLGFQATEEDGLVTATGQDPDLRVLMAADPLYSVPVNALFAEVRAQIDADETLSNPREANGRLTYTENPGDDSEVTWTTWVEDGHQISLGCHTRKAPTVVQKAACRMAGESLEKIGD